MKRLNWLNSDCESMVTNDEIREFAENISTDTLPREEEYRVMAARPVTETETVTPPIKGYY